MEDTESIMKIARELGLTVSKDSFFNSQFLAEKVNELINTDFQKLVSILYRMDVSEPKLKLLLKNNPGADAGILIADLMIERQTQKLKSRAETRNKGDVPEDEKW